MWFEPGLVVEVLAAELTPSPNHTAGWGKLTADAGLALRFPRFTGRWRDDKAPEDATTTDELLQLYQRRARADRPRSSAALERSVERSRESWRSRARPRRIRVLAVPSGIPSWSAISLAVKPYTAASTIGRACSAGKARSPARIRSIALVAALLDLGHQGAHQLLGIDRKIPA